MIVACYKFVAPLQTWTECYFSSDSQLKMVVSNCLHQSGCDCTGNEILASYKWTQSWVILWPGFTTLKLSHLWLNCLFFPFISFSLRLGFKRAAHSLKLSASVRGLLIGTSFFLIAHKLKQLWGKLWIPQVSIIVWRFGPFVLLNLKKSSWSYESFWSVKNPLNLSNHLSIFDFVILNSL